MPSSAIVTQFFSSLMRVYRTFPPVAPERRQREEQDQLQAAQREKERLEAEQWENERQEAERLQREEEKPVRGGRLQEWLENARRESEQKQRLAAEQREREEKERLEAERRQKKEQERLEAERRETKAKPGIDSRISDVSEIDDINESVLAQLSEIGHRMLYEFNIDNTIHSLLETNSVGIHCWSTIKEPGKVIAFFILAPISGTTCKRVLETEIRGAKQLRKTDFVKKTGNAGGIYIMCIVATKWRYRAYLMKHLKEEIAFLLTRNPGIEYIFTRPINRNVASLATKYGFTRIADYPSPIFFTTRSKMVVKDELLYPYRKSDKKAPG